MDAGKVLLGAVDDGFLDFGFGHDSTSSGSPWSSGFLQRCHQSGHFLTSHRLTSAFDPAEQSWHFSRIAVDLLRAFFGSVAFLTFRASRDSADFFCAFLRCSGVMLMMLMVFS
jgi:hypothetical protein